ncbi:MAG TPA: PSD1 and planctomycete cytochrome C domain-containing protein [Pirellulales bacterium]|nr:PSD1 and planctomycete cytochrome C domain-containing protein [Pirellulales bacterium]
MAFAFRISLSPRSKWFALCAAVILGSVLAGPASLFAGDIPAGDFFEAKIRPLLAANCYQCHGDKKQESDLRLDSRQAAMKGGSDGAVIVPGQPEKSLLVQAVRYHGDTKMPPKKPLPADQVETLATWVKLGAPWPDSPAAGAPSASGGIADPKHHWAFQPVREPAAPRVKNAAWVKSPVDAFVLAKLEAKAISPAPPVDRPTLIRRATFDLIGLPPTPAEVDAFVHDATPDAFAKVVDRLLASPHYGERWGRYWLDVARYADNKGYVGDNKNREIRYAYLYRDWIIHAFNSDLPYDQFLVKQIAADRLPHKDNLDLPAMGLLTVGRRFINDRQLIIDDQIDVISRGMLGLTVTCARCHNHKFDPIPTADYYSLYGVLNSSEEKEVPLKPGSAEKALIEEDRPHPSNSHIFIRGNSGNQGAEVPRQFLEVLSGPDRKPFHDGSGRLELARKIASADNPLTARVMVNRVWLHHFGTGLVRTPSDFGARSDPPSNPELLDYLASRFVKQGWSIKRLHRAIMLSSVYQESSNGSAKSESLDPENRLFSHFNRQRLDFEAMRDALLAAGGELDEKIGGPSIDLLKEPFVRRRTVYSYVDRQNLQGLLRTFDFASPDAHSPMRHVTTIPQQALFLMNSPFVVQQAERLAARSEIASASDTGERVRRMYRLVYSREPTADEIALARQYLAAPPPGGTGAKPHPDDKLTPWQRYAQALLMTNEFVYID